MTLRPLRLLALAVFALTIVGCPGGTDDDGGDGGEGEGEGENPGEGEGEGENPGEGEGEGENPGEGEGEGPVAGPLCSPGGWCFEAPSPGGGPLLAVAAASADVGFASTLTSFLHRDDAGLTHQLHPGGLLGTTSMWAASDVDAWAVSGRRLHRFVGVAWVPDVTLPLGTGVDVVNGFAANDVWAVGATSIAHTDGLRWQTFTPSVFLTDVVATGPRSAVVGGIDVGAGRAVVQRLTLVDDDGVTTLSTTDLAFPGTGFATSVSVFGRGDEVWLAMPGQLWRYAGTTWTQLVSDNFALGRDISGRAVDDIWFTAGASVLHWDGGALASTAVPNATSIVALAATDDGAVWLADSNGALHRKTATSTRSDNLPLVPNDFTHIASDGEVTLALARDGRLAERSVDGTWSLIESPTTSLLVGVGVTTDGVVAFAQGGSFRRTAGDWQLVIGGAGLSSSCVDGTTTWAIGAGGAARLVDGEWQATPITSTTALSNLRCGAGKAFASTSRGFGSAERLYEFHDGAFRLRNLSSLVDLDVIHGFAADADDGWVVASTDAFAQEPEFHTMHLVDGVWREVAVGFAVAALDGSDVDDVVFVGAAGRAARWNGAAIDAIDAAGAPDFIAVDARGDGDYRAVSELGAVWDYVDGSWSETAAASIDATFGDRLVDVAFFENDIYATTRFDAVRFRSGTWSSLGIRATDVEANATAGVFLRTDISREIQHLEDNDTFVTVAPSPTFSSGLYLPPFGSTVFTVDGGTISRLSGTSFVDDGTGQGAFFDRAIFFGVDDTHLTLVGIDNAASGDPTIVLQKRGTTWSTIEESGLPAAIAALPSGTYVVAADLGMTRERNGVTTVIAAAPDTLFAPVAVAAVVIDFDDVWALAGGNLVHFDGAAWSSAEPVGVIVSTLAQGLDGDVFAGAGPGALLRLVP